MDASPTKVGGCEVKADTEPALAVFPCHSIADGKCTCGRDDCHSPGKHPRTKSGLLDATSDPSQQAAWWEQWPNANIAIATGSTNGIVVIDVDAKKDGWDALEELELRYGKLPATVEVNTGGGGWHGYFRMPEGETITSRNGFRNGVDVKAEGGYVIAPPSTHKSGRKYEWAQERGPNEIEIAELPDSWIRALPRKGQEPPKTNQPIAHAEKGDVMQRAQAYVAKASAASEGTRNDAAFRLAGHVASFGTNGSSLGESDIITLLAGWNLRNSPPLEESELRQCVASALANGTPRPPKGMSDLRPAEYRDTPAATPRKEITYKLITSAELATGDYKVEYAIEGAMVFGQPLLIGGPQKNLKTSILVDGGVSAASGGYFLGKFKVARPYRTMIMSAESGMASLQDIAHRVCNVAGRRLAELSNLFWSPDIPKFGSHDHMEALEKFLADNGIEVLFIDPAYLAMPSADAGNLMAQGELLRNIAELCERLGVSLVICHHSKKHTGQDPYEPLELQHLAWAGFAEFARQWWLVNRREKYTPGTGDHRLWLSFGGSAGHSSLWAMDVNEGTIDDLGGRRWDVNLTDAAGARDAAKERQSEARKQAAQERQECDRKAICEAIAALPDRKATKTDLKAAAGLNTNRFSPALASLLTDKILIPTTVAKGNGQQYEAFTLA